MPVSGGSTSGVSGGQALAGALDARNVAVVREALSQLLDATPGDVILDVSGVDAVDAVGLGVLASAHRRAEREGRRLVLHGCQGPLRRVLSRTKLSRAMRLEHDQVTA